MWVEDDTRCWHQGRGSVMKEILTEDGSKCQSQEWDKGCCSHGAEVAYGSQVEAKEVLSGVCPAHLGAALYTIKSSCLSCEIAFSRNGILVSGEKRLIGMEIPLL